MAVRTDFNATLDHAAGLTLDATCSLRAAGARPLPHPHRRQLTSAVRSLERAQDILHLLSNDPTAPWQSPTSPSAAQLELL